MARSERWEVGPKNRWKMGLVGGGRWTLKISGRWEIGPTNMWEMGCWPPKQVGDG